MRGHVTPFWSKRCKEKSLGEAFRNALKGEPAGDSSRSSLFIFSLALTMDTEVRVVVSRFLSTMKMNSSISEFEFPKQCQCYLLADLFDRVTILGCSVIYGQYKF